MKKDGEKSEFKQMAILSAGTFANVLTAILFFGVLWIFFTTAFVPSGVMFDSYATSAIAISGISSVNGINVNLPRVDNSSVSYEDVIKLTNSDGLNRIGVGSKSYLITKEALEKQNGTMGVIGVYDSAPAIKANLSSVILEINGIKVDSIDKLAEELSKYSPGTKVMIKTKTKEGSDLREIILEEHPENQELRG